MNGVRAEILKEAGVTVLEWLERLFDIRFMLSMAPVNWVFTCTVLLYKDSEQRLCRLVTELRVNVGKSRLKVRRCTGRKGGARLNVMLNGKLLEEVDQFKYLGTVTAANGGVESDVCQKMNEGCKVLGAMKEMVKNTRLGMHVKRVLYEKVIVPTVMAGLELWGMLVTQRQKFYVFMMKCLSCKAGVS
ncbi:uncharacterized protein [Palaemon carinicauda]|uniref:uncharacterized protein n=1 Tax=Palaemon carinicauda TaxID=392227 RepID=UPI0035B69B8E